MGFLGKLFNKEEELPPLDSASQAASKLKEFKATLEQFVGNVNDRIEIVPAPKTVYVFIGKPPSQFGLVWPKNGDMANFKTITAEKGLDQPEVLRIYGRLGETYDSFKAEARFETTIAGKKVIVLPSEDFGTKIDAILHAVV